MRQKKKVFLLTLLSLFSFTLERYIIVSGQTARNGTFYNAMFCSLYCMFVRKRNQYIMYIFYPSWGRGRDRMVVGFTTTCAISAYHH